MPCLYVGKFINYSVLSQVHQCKALPSVCSWATGDNVWVYLPRSKSTPRCNWSHMYMRVLLLYGHSPLSQSIPASALISVTAEVPLLLQDSLADTAYMTNDLWNILTSFLSVIQVINSKKEIQVRTIIFCYKDGVSWRREPVSSDKLKPTWAQQMSAPLTELPSLDNKTLILCCCRIQKCSLRSREVFTEHQSLQHLLNRTNQTAGFLIKEHLMKWWLHVCVPSYHCKKGHISKCLWHMETKNALFITMPMWQQ